MLRLATVLMMLATLATAQAGEGRRMLDASEAAGWNGVGRLNIAGNRFCTATLVTPTLAITAAHCLYNPRTHRRVAPSAMRFVAGLRLGGHAGMRRVVRTATLRDYRYTNQATVARIKSDVALIELEGPIRAATFDTAPVRPHASSAVTVVSYARDRAHAPSIEDDCRVLRKAGAISALSCDVTFGASGAPVFAGAGTTREIVAVISALGASNGETIALAVDVGPMMPQLRARLDAQPVSQRLALGE